MLNSVKGKAAKLDIDDLASLFWEFEDGNESNEIEHIEPHNDEEHTLDLTTSSSSANEKNEEIKVDFWAWEDKVVLGSPWRNSTN